MSTKTESPRYLGGTRKRGPGFPLYATPPDAAGNPTSAPAGVMERGFGFTHPDKDVESMCQACKNEDNGRLGEHEDHHAKVEAHLGHTNFRAYQCHCCGAKWWHLLPEPP